jgi:hypothetical protein
MMVAMDNLLRLTVAVAGVMAFTTAGGQAADLATMKKSPHRETRIVYREYPARVRDCNGGWWQSVHWGHVQPRYLVRCRYAMVRN